MKTVFYALRDEERSIIEIGVVDILQSGEFDD